MKVKCQSCDAMILPETAHRNGGLCARCAIDGAPTEPVAIFVPDRVRRFGVKNPEVMNLPFWHYMMGSGCTAYGAYDMVFGSRPKTRREHPVWCFRRFGQSRTEVPERGIVVCIGGEHEDYYDEDFCIYNDVVVFDPSEGNTIYGYPRSDFAPTDFHTATLIDDDIWIIGNLGYIEDRKLDRTPVYRLNLDTMRIDYVPTIGDKPGWVWKHEAHYVADDGEIVVSGGQRLRENSPNFRSDELSGRYALDLASARWRRVD